MATPDLSSWREGVSSRVLRYRLVLPMPDDDVRKTSFAHKFRGVGVNRES